VLENLTDIEGANCLDLFAGTGAVSFEFLSREAAHVTAVEKAATQWRFIAQVAQQLNEKNLTLVRGDMFRFVAGCSEKFDVVFADPPYDLPRFGEIPGLILGSKMLHDGTVVVIEHSKNYDFSALPHFLEHRAYGSVNFSIFRISEASNDSRAADVEV
jgi:16S rRNA (guanine(966)-N(2))-methyltransferase RsmD